MSGRTRIAPVVRRQRIAQLLLAFAVIATLLTGRLAYIQIVRHQHFRALALEQRLRGVPTDPLRGTIYDRNMNELAVSVSSDAVYVRPVEVEDKAGTAATLSRLLNLPYEDVLARVQRPQAEVWIKRRVSEEEAAAVREASLPGVYLAHRTGRTYPYGQLAAHVLGIVGIDNQGLEGLELYYDELLRGTPGRVLSERDAAGRTIPIGESVYVPPTDGAGLVLTIDAAIQAVAERELERACIATLSEFCLTVWMDPRNGHILALAVYPTFDPNSPGDYPASARRNRVVTDQFEPGSTFKIVTTVAALAEGVVTPDETFYDAGYIDIGGGRVHCWRGGGHGTLTFAEAVQHSCNPVFAELGGLRLGPERFYPYLQALGFGQRLGIDYPGEARGLVPQPGQLAHGEVLQWANIGFGQGVAVSPLQLLTALAAVANGGVRMQPQLVQAVVDPLTQQLTPVPPQPVYRVVSEETARLALELLRGVVETGSGTNAAIPGYSVAGKTGTAQVAEGGVYTDKRIASFIGVAPVEEPRLVGLVALYDLQPRPAYGGVHAAPVWRAIAETALELLGVPKQDADAAPTRAADGVRVPNVQNLPLPEAEAVLRAAGLVPQAEGVGTYVLEQTPMAGAVVPPGTTVVLEFWDVPDHWRGETTVPDVRGMTMRQAAERLADVGLVLDPRGSAATVAVSQWPLPGQTILRGMRVEVQFGADE